MISLNLEYLLAKQRMSIKQLSEKTGINRASLSQMANNETKMIKFDSLNKILNALSASPEELIVYEPDSNFAITHVSVDSANRSIMVHGKSNNLTESHEKSASFEYSITENIGIISVQNADGNHEFLAEIVQTLFNHEISPSDYENSEFSNSLKAVIGALTQMSDSASSDLLSVLSNTIAQSIYKDDSDFNDCDLLIFNWHLINGSSLTATRIVKLGGSINRPMAQAVSRSLTNRLNTFSKWWFD